MAGKSLIGALRVTLGLDSAEFTKGGAKSRKELSNLQKGANALKGALVGMIGFEVINQFRQLGRAALDNVGGLGEQAAAIGVNTDALQQYRFIALQTGVEQASLDKGLQQLTRRLGEAAMGAKAPNKALDQLGVKLTDAKGKVRDTDAVLLDIIGGLERIDGAAKKAAIAKGLFGKSAQDLMPLLTEGKAKIKDYITEANKLGVVIDAGTIANADKVADDLAKQEKVMEMRMNGLFARNAKAVATTEGAWQDFKIGFIQVAAEVIDGVSAMGDDIVGIWGDLSELAGNVSTEVSQAWAVYENWWNRTQARANAFVATVQAMPGKVIASVKAMVVGVSNWLGNQLNAVFDGVKKRVDAVGTWFYDLYDKVVGHSYIPDMVDEIGVHMARLDAEMVSPTVKATTKAAEAFRALQQEVAGILSRLFPEQALFNDFQKEKAALQKYHMAGQLSADAHARAVRALVAEYAAPALLRGQKAVIGGASAGESWIAARADALEGLRDGAAEYRKTMARIGSDTDVLRVKVVESFAEMVDGGLRQLDRFMKGIKSGNWLDIVGGLLGAINGIGGALTGGKGFNLGPFTFGSGGSQVPGFAQGGAMKLGGFRGIDRNMLSLNGSPIARVSESEQLSITPANDRGGGATKIFDMRGAVVTADLLRQMNSLADDRVRVMAPGIARAGASMAVGQMRRAAGRQLA